MIERRKTGIGGGYHAAGHGAAALVGEPLVGGQLSAATAGSDAGNAAGNARGSIPGNGMTVMDLYSMVLHQQLQIALLRKDLCELRRLVG